VSGEQLLQKSGLNFVPHFVARLCSLRRRGESNKTDKVGDEAQKTVFYNRL
jgi:hypothetical protein